MADRLDERPWFHRLSNGRWLLAVCFAWSIFLLSSPIHAEGPFKDIYFLNLGNTLSGIHVRDTQLAFQVVMNKVVRTRYPNYRIIADFPKDTAAARNAIDHGTGHVLIINSMDFLELRQNVALEPLQVLSKTDRPVEPYLLIVAAGENIETLAKLADRSLIVVKGGSGEIARVWLSTRLGLIGRGRAETFFSSIREADKPSRAILPVFFGEASACVVSESAYAIMTELNPQIRQKLAILARSPGFVNLIVCATQQLNPVDKQRVVEEAMAMNDTVDGQQILTIVQMKRIFKFKPDEFAATAALYREFRSLVEKKE